MNALRATLRLYGRCFTAAGRDFPRSLPAMLALLIFSALLVAINQLLAAAGMSPGASFATGFIVALIHAGCVGAYLSMLEASIIEKRPARLSDIPESFGTYLWEVISILFIFFLAQIVVVSGLRAYRLWWVIMLVSTVVFNPTPELIYQGRSRGLELLKDAARFMRRAGLEWLPPQLLLVGLVVLWQPVLFSFAVRAFGPFFGFMEAGDLFFVGMLGRVPQPIEIALLLCTVAATHFVMLLRGHLFQGLDTGGRRMRAWREKFED